MTQIFWEKREEKGGHKKLQYIIFRKKGQLGKGTELARGKKGCTK